MAAGDRAGARESLREAAAAAEQLGAGLITSRVATFAGARRLGARGRGRVTSTGSALNSRHAKCRCLELIAQGFSNRQIGEKLFISAKTASVHVSAILRKLNASAARRPFSWRRANTSITTATIGCMGRTFVIVGAGLAGATAAGALRDRGFAGRIVLIGAEPELPYDRLPLSKDYLLDRSEKAKIYVHPRQWYADRDIELRLRTRVTAIDRVAHAVELDGGERIGYDKLLLATGAVSTAPERAGRQSWMVFGTCGTSTTARR